MLRACFLGLLVYMIIPVGPAWGAEEKETFNMDVKTEGIKLGKAVCGPAVSTDNLKNHVVLLAFWGVKCPASLTSLNQLTDWQQQHGEAGLIVIGSETSGAAEEEIRKLAVNKGVQFAVVQDATVEGGGEIKTTPHCLIFSSSGKCVYRGLPAQAGAKLKETVQAAPSPVLSGREFKKLGNLAAAYGKPDSAALILRKAQTLAKSPDADTAAEASWIIEKLTTYGKERLESAKARVKDEPVETHATLQKLTADFKDLEIGKSAAAALTEFKREVTFTRELEAHDLLLKVRTLEAQLRFTDLDPKSTDFKYPNSPLLLNMASTIRIIQRKYPATKANDKAKEIVERYDLYITPDKGTSGGI